jgi:hypothetical protein
VRMDTFSVGMSKHYCFYHEPSEQFFNCVGVCVYVCFLGVIFNLSVLIHNATLTFVSLKFVG